MEADCRGPHGMPLHNSAAQCGLRTGNLLFIHRSAAPSALAPHTLGRTLYKPYPRREGLGRLNRHRIQSPRHTTEAPSGSRPE